MVMPAYDTPAPLLRQAIASVRAQLYPHWELCVADDASPAPHVAAILTEAAAADPRITWRRLPRNHHIAGATNAAIALAKGEWVALMDHDDLLPERALYEIAVAAAAHPQAEVIYGDEDKVDGAGRRHTPYFKPDFDPDLLLGQNFVCHLAAYRRTLLQRLGGKREGFEGSQDHDLILRAAAAVGRDRIVHVPAILYHWRHLEAGGSFSQGQLAACVAASRRAVRDHLASIGAGAAQVVANPAEPNWSRVIWPLPTPVPRVSIIVPTRDRADLLERCARGILAETDYPEIELIIADNDTAEPAALALLARLRQDPRVRVLPCPGPFNYAAINNAAAAQATGEVLLLLNNDIEVLEAGWLRELVAQALRPDVGAVGAKLLYPDGTIQHAGVLLGMGRFRDGPGVAGHFGLHAAGSEIGPFGQYVLSREFAAVTAACLAMRRSVFEAVGGLDARNLAVAFNDVDLCLRVRELGLRVVWTPFALLKHHESASRGLDTDPAKAERFNAEADYMRRRWGPVLDQDPFLNANLSREGHLAAIALPPRRPKPWAAHLGGEWPVPEAHNDPDDRPLRASA
ncbi:hypothetical protein CKO45_18965 [Paracraurococcus ruber]|uniref:Glycosyltransferase 2-like domain-containing protein n=1 Tax=Paracraurococcus ruber TaxID=77675 RepID=A0ABS1D0I1_9PROT|nr:hypothetical protein [Paracraurococcus ruber]